VPIEACYSRRSRHRDGIECVRSIAEEMDELEVIY
jgi:hypothetical protein